jgi:hypothetical protein
MEAAYLWLAAHTELHAPTWYNGMLEANNPDRDKFPRGNSHGRP